MVAAGSRFNGLFRACARLRQIFTWQSLRRKMRPRNIIPRESVEHAARGLLGSDQQFVVWDGLWKRRTEGFSRSLLGSLLRFPFFSFLLFLFPLPSLTRCSEASFYEWRKSDDRENRETWFSRVKIKILPSFCPTGIQRSGDRRCFSKNF